mgnify:CR=1 FL=1
MDKFIAQLENELKAHAGSQGKSLDRIFLESNADRSNFNKAKAGRIKLEWTAFESLLDHVEDSVRDTLRREYKDYRSRRAALSKRAGPTDRQLFYPKASRGDLEAFLASRGIDRPNSYDFAFFRDLVNLTINKDRRAGRPVDARRAFYVLVGAIDSVSFRTEDERALALSSVACIGRYTAYQSGDKALSHAARFQAKRACRMEPQNALATANFLHMLAKPQFSEAGENERLLRRRISLLENAVSAIRPNRRASGPSDIRGVREFVFRSDLARARAKILKPEELVSEVDHLLELAYETDAVSKEQIAIAGRRVAQAELMHGDPERALHRLHDHLAEIMRNQASIPNWLIGTDHRELTEAYIKLASRVDNAALLEEAHRHCRTALHYFNEANNRVFAREVSQLGREIRARMGAYF